MRFSEIQGQEEIKRKLVQTVLDQRVSHAQLFFGPEGCDKLALAIAYAQYINCTNKSDQRDSCGICPSCQKYQKLIHPDLHFVFPVATTKRVKTKPQSKHFIEEWRKFLLGNKYQVGLQGWYEAIEIENKQGIINAEDCNEIITTLSYKSYEADYKVMILWMVEKLYYAAAPKILKILEEPPEKTLFLLISENPEQIIKTILSRTLLVKVPSTRLGQPARLEEEAVYFEPFRQWMRTCYSGKIVDLISFSTEIARTGRERQKGFLNYGLKMVGWCTSFNFLHRIPQGIDGEELKFIQDFSPFIKVEKLPEFNEVLNTAIFHIERNAHGPTLFLDLSLKIVQLFKPNFLPLQ
ncbi:MAG: DNA polymerase III subunit delta [Bacteroidales bacterium]|nr:DNA polymerase III subunit delta [Bacteroidales bacterium]MDD4603494.1 DNA polymerase III subunit delta [Bacteroidales bacterium]